MAVFGYYGFGNLGDEAALHAMLSHLRDALPGVEVQVASGDPAWTERAHGVGAVPRTDFAAVRRLFRSCDLVCSGGGSLFQDATSWRSPLFYLTLHELACPTPVLVYAQGVGPLRRRLSRWATRRAMDRAARVTVRDPDSARLLEELGVRQEAEVVCDPAVDLVPRNTPARTPTMAVCVRPWPGVPWRSLVEALREASRRADLRPRVVCLHRRVDEVTCQEVARELGAELVTPSHPREAVEAFADTRVVVGMRLHALVLAAAAGVPFVGVAYDPKVASFARSVHMPCVPATLPDPDALVGHVAELASDPAVATRLRAQVEALRPLARRPALLAAQLLGACP